MGVFSEQASWRKEEYAGNYIYKNGVLEFFNHSEGIVEKEADGYKYVYQFKDHLGNIRLSYKDADKDGAITQDEIVEVKDYYPFGMQINYGANHPNSMVNGRKHNYGYNGKEEQSELGLEWLDFGARNYNPDLGRWMNIDPLASKYYLFSPYNYVANNPIFFIDPDGKDITIPVVGKRGSLQDLRNRRSIITNLQKLTNRKLKVNRVGNNYVVREVKGSNVNTSKNLKTGTALISKLIGSKKNVSIVLGKLNSTGPSKKDKNGKSSSKIFFNPKSEKGPVNEDGTRKRKVEIGLAHELIHAETNADGNENTEEISVDDPDQEGADNKLQAQEIPIREKEDLIRDEQGHVLRAKVIVNDENKKDEND